MVPLWRKLPKQCRHFWTNATLFILFSRTYATLSRTYATLLNLSFSRGVETSPQTSQKKTWWLPMPILLFVVRGIEPPPICRYFTDPFLISCPTFLLIFTVAAIFDSSGGRQGCQPFFHLIPSLADSRPIVLSFINNSPAVLYNMFSITIGSAKINIII